MSTTPARSSGVRPNPAAMLAAIPVYDVAAVYP
jgi:hypothetical protein